MEGLYGRCWERDWNGTQARIREQRRAMSEKLETRISTLTANEVVTRYFQSTEIRCGNVDEESKDTKEFLTVLCVEDQFTKLWYSGNEEGRDEFHDVFAGEHWTYVDIKGALLASLKVSSDGGLLVQDRDTYGCPEGWGIECHLAPTRADVRELNFYGEWSSRTGPLIKKTPALLKDDGEYIRGQSGYRKGFVVDLSDATLESEDRILDVEGLVGQRLLSFLEYGYLFCESVDLFLGIRIKVGRNLLHDSLQHYCVNELTPCTA